MSGFRGSVLIALFLAGAPMAQGGGGGCDDQARLSVTCSRASAFVQVHLANCRKLGKLVLEVRDQHGRVLYHEEGKAYSGELVRRLDKGQLPRGTHVLSIAARDLSLAQPFTIE